MHFFLQEISRTSQTYRRQNQSACPACCAFLSRRARLPWHTQKCAQSSLSLQMACGFCTQASLTLFCCLHEVHGGPCSLERMTDSSSSFEDEVTEGNQVDGALVSINR